MSETAEPAVPVTVLVADGDELLVKGCGRVLSGEGYSVLSETRARGALESVRRHRPDIVLTGLTLPDMDGLVLVQEVKRLAPGTTVIVAPAFGRDDASARALLLGACDTLTKPFTADQLRTTIGRAARQLRRPNDTPPEPR